MSDFVAGFSARHDAAAALQRAFMPPGGFAPSGMPGIGLSGDGGPVSFRARAPMGDGAGCWWLAWPWATRCSSKAKSRRPGASSLSIHRVNLEK